MKKTMNPAYLNIKATIKPIKTIGKCVFNALKLIEIALNNVLLAKNISGVTKNVVITHKTPNMIVGAVYVNTNCQKKK